MNALYLTSESQSNTDWSQEISSFATDASSLSVTLIWNPLSGNTVSLVHIVIPQNQMKKRNALELVKDSLRLGASSVDLIRVDDLQFDQIQSHQNHKMQSFLVRNFHVNQQSNIQSFIVLITEGLFGN